MTDGSKNKLSTAQLLVDMDREKQALEDQIRTEEETTASLRRHLADCIVRRADIIDKLAKEEGLMRSARSVAIDVSKTQFIPEGWRKGAALNPPEQLTMSAAPKQKRADIVDTTGFAEIVPAGIEPTGLD